MGYGDGGRGGNGSTTLRIIAILALVVAAILAVILLVRPPPPVVCKPGQELVVQCRDKPVETPCYDDCDRHRDREEVVTTLVPDGDPYLTDAVNELWNSVDAQIRHFNDPETLLAIDRADDVALYCIARRHHDPEFVLDAVLNSVANTDLRRDRLRLAQEPLAGLVFPGPELAVVNERCPEKTEREDERKGLPVVPWGPRDQAGRTPVGLIGGAPEPATEGDAGRAARFLEDSDAREYRACEKPRVTSLFINGIDTTQDDAELASNLMFKGLETVFSDKTLSCALAKESNSAGEDQCRAPVFGDRVNEDIDGDPTDVGRSDWDDLSDSEKTALYGRPGIAHYFAYNWSEDEAPTESFWQRFDALDLKESKAIREVRKELDSRREADPSFPPNPSAWLDENLSIKFNPQSNDSSTIDKRRNVSNIYEFVLDQAARRQVVITGYSQGSQYAALFDTLAEPEFTDERIYANLAATPVGRRPAKSTPSSYTTVREDGVINNPSTLAPFGGVSFDRLPPNCTNIQNSIWPWLPQGHSWGFYMKPDRPGTWPSTRKLLETVAAVYAFGTNPLSPDHCDREPTDVAITDDGRQIPILEGVDPALLNEFGDDGVLPAARGLMMNVFAYDGETGAPLVIDQLNRGAGASVGAFGGATRAHFAADEIDGGDPLTMAVRRVVGDGEVAQRLTVESDRLYCAQMLSVSEYMPSAPYAPTTAFSFAIKPNIFAARHAASKIDYAPVKRGADRDADGPPLPEAITPVVTVRHAYDRRHHGACVDGRNENGWIATCVRAEDRIVFVDHTKTFAKGFLSGNESIDVSVSVRETADGFVPFFNQTSYSVPVEKDELLVYKPTPDGIKVLDWPPKPKPPHKPKSKPPLDDAQPEPEPEPVAGEPDVGPDDAPVQCPFRPFPEQYCEEVSYADPSRQVGAWDGPVAFTDGPYGAPMIQCCNQVEREGAFSSLRRKQQVCDVYRYDPFWCGRTSQPWRRVPGPGSPDIDWVRRTSPASTPGY